MSETQRPRVRCARNGPYIVERLTHLEGVDGWPLAMVTALDIETKIPEPYRELAARIIDATEQALRRGA